MAWDLHKKASKLWILLGLIGVGQIVALIYSLIYKKDEDRFIGILFILGLIGDIIIYLIERKKDRYMADIAIYLLVGEVLLAAVSVFYLSGIFSPSVIVVP